MSSSSISPSALDKYVTKTQPQGERASKFSLATNRFDPRYRDDVPDGLQNAIVWLGDSISHGAYQGNLYQDGMVNIMKRKFRAQNGEAGYGHTPMLGWASHATATSEVHDVAFSEGNSWLGLESTSGGGDIMQGLAFQSSVIGDSITFTVPTFQKIIRMWFVTDVGAGSFSYSINDAPHIVVDTSGVARDVSTSIAEVMKDDGYGQCKIEIKVVSGTVTFCGIGYEMGLKGNVQNFSQSGRKLEPITEQTVDFVCRGAVLVLALGHNDVGLAENDSAYADSFNQKIDWIIKYCNKYNTTLFVADFCWWTDETSPVRVALKRAAKEANGTYIPLPEYLTKEGFLKNEYGDGYFQVDSSYLFYDTSHPKMTGAKWAAESISSDMGLSVTSKSVALNIYDYNFPLQLISGGAFKNRFDTYGDISCVNKSGNVVGCSLRIEKIGGGGFSVGDYVINSEFSGARQVKGKFTVVSPARHSHIDCGADNEIAQTYTVSQNLAITMHSKVIYLNEIDKTFSMLGTFS